MGRQTLLWIWRVNVRTDRWIYFVKYRNWSKLYYFWSKYSHNCFIKCIKSGFCSFVYSTMILDWWQRFSDTINRTFQSMMLRNANKKLLWTMALFCNSSVILRTSRYETDIFAFTTCSNTFHGVYLSLFQALRLWLWEIGGFITFYRKLPHESYTRIYDYVYLCLHIHKRNIVRQRDHMYVVETLFPFSKALSPTAQLGQCPEIWR